MAKKIVALILVIAMLVVGMAGCGKKATDTSSTEGLKPIAKEDIKVGFVYIGKINDGGYTQAHDKGRLALKDAGYTCYFKEDVPETADCETAINELIDLGCNVIYTTSFGHGTYTKNVAAKNPNIYFAHATGSELAPNMANYMGRVEEARYLTGIVAGMKTKNGKIGYVAAYPYAECIRGINSFTLGVQSVNPSATVEVIFTSTWYDPVKEKQAAYELLNKGVDVLAQHQDSTACQVAAEEKGVFAIGYNTPTPNAAPKAYLTAALFNWSKFYLDNVKAVVDGTWESTSYWKGLKDGWVGIDNLTALTPEGAQDKVNDAKAKLISGELKLFSGEIKAQDDTVIGTNLTDEQIYNMDKFIKGVIGKLS